MDLMKQKGLELLTPQWIGPILRTQEKISQLLETVDEDCPQFLQKNSKMPNLII